MNIRWKRWSRQSRKWLWMLTIAGVLAALPIGMLRMQTESSSNAVEYIFDYRDIMDVASEQPKPATFLQEQLEKLKDAGIETLAVYESSFMELKQAGRLTYYDEDEVSLLEGKLRTSTNNFTYILFSGDEEKEAIAPLIHDAMDRKGFTYSAWQFQGREGLVIEQPLGVVLLQTLDFDPMTLQMLQDEGFHLVARFSDRVTPYDASRTEDQLKRLKAAGVAHLLFDGLRAKGASDHAALRSLDSFGQLLEEFDLGLITIENLRVPQEGLNKLAYMTDYNVVRSYSLSPEDSQSMTKEGIADRFLLAAKDRNIRMFFLNTKLQSNSDKGEREHALDKIASMMGGEDGVIAQLAEEGFHSGHAEAFKQDKPSWVKPLRAIVMLGSVALIALLIGAFVPTAIIPVFFIGLMGAAGLYVPNSSIMEQALALGVAISAPSLALIWVMNRVYARTIGERRMIGGSESWKVGGASQSKQVQDQAERTIWLFPKVPTVRALQYAITWFVVATVISWTAIPLIVGLLNNMTYSLVLEQFRGVSVLYFAPLLLVALYVFLYEGPEANGVIGRAIRIVKQPITVLWVLVVVVLAVVGAYYLSRSGNAGQVSSIEMMFRSWLESTFGVRPRFKEFILGHPPLLLGLFLALRYRAAWVLIIVGCLGQLSMVSTFTHIHTPLIISSVRTLLGIGVGLVFGALLIVGWIGLEGAWKKWVLPQIRKYSA